MAKAGFAGLYLKAVDALSFSGELYKLRRELNSRIDQPDTIQPVTRSHPLGVARWFKKRRISIAEAYLMVLKDLDSRHCRSRLRALKVMVDASFHAKTLDMPLNTARVQMALIKEAVKNRDDRRKQLELLQDFGSSSYGLAQVIRKLCDRLNIVELPENGKDLKDLDSGWDLHVHDMATTGRKNPTQLLIDAFIKGISELTIAYNGSGSLEMMEEAVEAGRVVGIRVNIGLEFSVNLLGERFHFMALLPATRRGEDVERFFKENRKALKPLLAGLQENQEGRVEAIGRLLDDFNDMRLGELNEGFPDDDVYRLPKLGMKGLAAFVPLSSASRTHLGEYLWSYYKPVLFNRVLYLKAQRGKALRDLRGKRISDWDFGIIDSRYKHAREEYRTMNPDILRRRYFSDPVAGDYSSAFDDLGRLARILGQAGCAIKLLHPLEHGLLKATKLLEDARGLLDFVEVYNMQDSVKRNPDEILAFCRAVNEHNARNARSGLKPCVPVCGSDADGRNPDIPGMGFIRGDRIEGRYRRRYMKRHVALPEAVSRLVQAAGEVADLDSGPIVPAIYSMGKISEGIANRIGDGEDSDAVFVPPARALKYLNPVLVNFLYAAVGFVVANHFIGPFYACLWLGITGFRNGIADLVAIRGTRLRQWTIRSVNFDNIARSLFWTGFSVPILGFIKERFDLIWPFAVGGIIFNAAKFFFISFSNGLYLATHNKIRGFDRRVIRANIFRSLISWPFATAFAPLGSLIGIPSIVQAKIWSDFVAGFIEGGSKYLKTLKLRQRDLEEIVPRIIESKKEERSIAVLDLLYLFREEPRTRTSLRAILGSKTASGGAESGAGALEALSRTVGEEKLDRNLVNYILKRHGNEVAVDLIGLVSETLPEFRDWLSAQAHPRSIFDPRLSIPIPIPVLAQHKAPKPEVPANPAQGQAERDADLRSQDRLDYTSHDKRSEPASGFADDGLR